MSTDEDSYSIPGIEDKQLLKMLYNGFIKNNILTQVIPDKMKELLYKYYVEYYGKINNFNFISSEFFWNKDIKISNNIFKYFCEGSLGEYKNAFCYYSGNFSDIEDTKDKILIPFKNERFSHNQEDLFMIFINNDLFKDIIDLLAEDYFEKNIKIYNKGTNTKKLIYDFTVFSQKNILMD